MARIQVGIIADRDSAGRFINPRPIYKEVEPDAETEKFREEVDNLFINHIVAYLQEKDAIEQRRKEREALFARINAQKAEELGFNLDV